MPENGKATGRRIFLSLNKIADKMQSQSVNTRQSPYLPDQAQSEKDPANKKQGMDLLLLLILSSVSLAANKSSFTSSSRIRYC